MKLYRKIFLVFHVISLSECFKILGIFNYCADTQSKPGIRLLRDLADTGHDVTIVSCYSNTEHTEKHTNISTTKSIDHINKLRANLGNHVQLLDWNSLQWGRHATVDYSVSLFETKSVHDILQTNETFDVMIVENMFDSIVIISHQRFNCPLIHLPLAKRSFSYGHFVDNSTHESSTSKVLANNGSETTFWNKLKIRYEQLAAKINKRLDQISENVRVFLDTFTDTPRLATFTYDANIVHDDSTNDSVLLEQTLKHIGGFDVLPPKPLPEEIKVFLDTATDGAILFSMETVSRNDSFKTEATNAILKVFSKIKQRVIWKFETDLAEKPDNVMTLDWLPQQDILAHPNVVCFIGHGGLLGTLEAVYFGVPILGLPNFLDQKSNAGDSIQNSFAIKKHLTNLNEKTFGKALNDLVYDPKYMKIAKQRSQMLRVQSMNEIDEAVYWIDFVVRHKRANRVTPPTLDFKWYQLYILDIMLFASTVIVIFFYILCFIVQTKSYNEKYVYKKVKII